MVERDTPSVDVRVAVGLFKERGGMEAV